jgi:hypothetical protein
MICRNCVLLFFNCEFGMLISFKDAGSVEAWPASGNAISVDPPVLLKNKQCPRRRISGDLAIAVGIAASAIGNCPVSL